MHPIEQLLNRLFGRNAVIAMDTHPQQARAVTIRAKTEHLIAEGNALEDEGQLAAAEARYRAALQLCPDLARAWLNLGNAQLAQEQFDGAADSYREALRLEPDYGAAHANLGKTYLKQKNYRNAVEHYSTATRILPNSADAWVGIGCAMEELRRYPEALEAYHRALVIQPDFPGAELNLGYLLVLLNQPDEALEHIQAALSSLPDSALGHFLLGMALKKSGFLPEAISQMQYASQLDPSNPNFGSAMLFTMLHSLNYSAAELVAAHLDYTRRFYAGFYPPDPQYLNRPEPARLLKVGYISGDFRQHPVSQFVESLFTYHDRAHFEIHAFHNYHSTDTTTDRLKKLVDQWHPIYNVENEAVAQLVHTLGIDILVDLAGYTDFSRLSVFARKPAPVQATWLGYLSTTGLATMDYRICDIYTDPPGLTERFHTEQLARLPDCQWCYTPYCTDLPPIGELPLLRNGYLSLGSFNNPTKLNDVVLQLWAEILNTLSKSRLYIAAASPGRTQERIVSVLSSAGIEPERIEFIPRLPYRDYLASIATVDVALDPFPYNGGTTSIDTLIMGVPLVTLAGNHSIARGGVSLLSNLGLPELIAATPQDYVNITRQLASDPTRLATLRGSLRDRVQTSPLMDGEHFTRNLEGSYRQMWQAWCNTQSPNSPL